MVTHGIVLARLCRGLGLLIAVGLMTAGLSACRHSCSVGGRPEAHFSIVSCCGSQRQYYWNEYANDCVELTLFDGVNCGCVCNGKDCDRLFWSLSECRSNYSHCR